MPFAIFLIVFYALSATQHENAKVVSDVQKAIKYNLEKASDFGFTGNEESIGHYGMNDIRTHTDFYSWMRNGFIPSLFTQEERITWNITLAFPEGDKRRGMWLQYNRIMGAVRMRVKRSPPLKECETDKKLAVKYVLKCVGGLGYENDPEKFDAQIFDEPDETLWLHTHKDFSELLSQVQKYEFDGDLLNNVTQRIEFGIPVFNGEYGLYTLTKVNFFFARTGHIWKDISSESVFADWWPNPLYIVVDAVFCLCIFYIVSKEILEARHMFVTNKGHIILCLRKYIDFWNMVDWFAVCAGITIIGLFRHNYNYTDKLNTAASKLGGVNPLELVNKKGEWQEAEYVELLTNMMSALEQELSYAHNFRYAMAIYPLVIIMRIFKAFSAQARLAVVTDAILCASVDLMHFGIVFLSVFGAFVISGVGFFGKDVRDFVTPARAFNQLFRALLGDLDWEDLRRAGRYEGMCFYVVFRLTMTQVMINLLISIIMDAYDKVKIQAQGAEMIWEELNEELKMRFGKKPMVPYWKIRNALKYDEKVDTLKKVETRPKNARTNFVEAHVANGRVTFSCFLQYPAMEKLGAEIIPIVGSVVACDGRGGVHEVKEGKTREFPVTLDEHGKFAWYYDTASKGSNSKFDLLGAVKEAAAGKSARGMVTTEYLLKAVDGMDGEQAYDILQDSINDFYALNHVHPGPEELRTMIMHLDHRTQKCLRAVMGEKKARKQYKDTAPQATAPSNNNDNNAAPPVTTVAVIADDAEEARATVGSELSQIFAAVKEAQQECQESLNKISPDHDKYNDIFEREGPEAAKFEDLYVGMHVMIVNDMRRIIRTCYDAGLSAANSKWRKESAGCSGYVVDVDAFDQTVCVDIGSIGKLWYAPGAIESPHGQLEWGPPREEHLARLEQEKEYAIQQEKELEARKAQTIDDHARLMVKKMQVDLRLGEVVPMAEEAASTCEKLKEKLEAQFQAKRKTLDAIELLEKREAKLAQEGRIASEKVREDHELLANLSESRNEYFDTMRAMVTENQRLRKKLEQESEKLQNLQAVASADARGVEMYHGDINHTINNMMAERTQARRAEQSELAWLVGNIENLTRSLSESGRGSTCLQLLSGLRERSLQASAALHAF